MILKTQSAPVPLTLLLLSLLSSGISQAKEDQIFEVELIAFTHLNPHESGEQWPLHHQLNRDNAIQKSTSQISPLVSDQLHETDTPLAIEHSDTPAPESGPGAAHEEFTQLAGAELQLSNLVSNLRRKRLAKRILLHTGWRQKIKPANSAVPVLIEGGFPLVLAASELPWTVSQSGQPATLGSSELSTEPFATTTTANRKTGNTSNFFARGFELEGTLAFYETRYPRLETNICLALTTDATLPLMMTTATASPTYPNTPTMVCNREIRGLKYGEVLYFDTPILGLLAQVRKVPEAPLPVQNDAEQSKPAQR